MTINSSLFVICSYLSTEVPPFELQWQAYSTKDIISRKGGGISTGFFLRGGNTAYSTCSSISKLGRFGGYASPRKIEFETASCGFWDHIVKMKNYCIHFTMIFANFQRGRGAPSINPCIWSFCPLTACSCSQVSPVGVQEQRFLSRQCQSLFLQYIHQHHRLRRTNSWILLQRVELLCFWISTRPGAG